MKPAHFTITYCVYEPNYTAGGKYISNVKTLKAAYKIAKSFGAGSEIVRRYESNNKRRCLSCMNPRFWVFNKTK